MGAARGRLHILGKTDAEMDALEATPARRAEAMVLAPIGGTVTQRQVGVGEYITSAANGGSSPACTIANLSKVWLMANVREDETPHLHVGQDVGVNVLALPGSMFKAIIVWVAAAVDPVTHRLAVRAEIPNPDGVLKPGMFASFNIATSSPTESLAVPQSAIIYDGEATRVLVVLGDGAITVRPVHIGRIREGMAEVSDGLHEGEKVVASGTLFVDQAAQGQ